MPPQVEALEATKASKLQAEYAVYRCRKFNAEASRLNMNHTLKSTTCRAQPWREGEFYVYQNHNGILLHDIFD